MAIASAYNNEMDMIVDCSKCKAYTLCVNHEKDGKLRFGCYCYDKKDEVKK